LKRPHLLLEPRVERARLDQTEERARRESTDERTSDASISSPSSSATPVARPFFTMILATARRRIPAPNARAADAMAFDTPPVPPSDPPRPERAVDFAM